MTLTEIASIFKVNESNLRSVVLENEIPAKRNVGNIILDDDQVDFVLELYYEKYGETKQNDYEGSNGAVYHIKGCRGRTIDIFPHKCVITVDVTIGSVITDNATDGEKTIFYSDCIGIQYKRAGLVLGYLQLETASSEMNNKSSNFFNENTFTYDQGNIPNSEMDNVVEYVKRQVEAIKLNSLFSSADEIKKYKALLDEGAITLDEYNAKKKQLLMI